MRPRREAPLAASGRRPREPPVVTRGNPRQSRGPWLPGAPYLPPESTPEAPPPSDIAPSARPATAAQRRMPRPNLPDQWRGLLPGQKETGRAGARPRRGRGRGRRAGSVWPCSPVAAPCSRRRCCGGCHCGTRPARVESVRAPSPLQSPPDAPPQRDIAPSPHPATAALRKTPRELRHRQHASGAPSAGAAALHHGLPAYCTPGHRIAVLNCCIAFR
ncbi:uncharacterized protein LOC143840516 [Paroedura picta]|uniref:uncharacterized protein LOC143840516 n=1 Tax=Paroedura picta TaxID=143630 RepID=UPI00405743FD